MKTKNKHFYTHLIEVEPILTTLDEVTISDLEKKTLITILEKTTHYAVIDVVLSELANDDKKKFIKHVAKDEHEEVWNLLSNKTKDISKKIKLAVRDIHLSMIDDIGKIVKNKKKQ